MYGASPNEVTAWGWRIEQIEGITEIWPCNHMAYFVFEAMGTQWRMTASCGACGSYSMPYGLEYTALPIVMQLQGVPKEDEQDVFADIRVMEDEALLTMREK